MWIGVDSSGASCQHLSAPVSRGCQHLSAPVSTCLQAINTYQHTYPQDWELRKAGLLVFLPEWCLDGGRNGQKFAHRHELLHPLANRGVLVPTPPFMDDDCWTLGQAKQRGCSVLSNDHFRKQIARGDISTEWRDTHVMKFAWVRNELDPKPYQRK